MPLLPLYNEANPPPGEPSEHRRKLNGEIVRMWGPMGHESRCVFGATTFAVRIGD